MDEKQKKVKERSNGYEELTAENIFLQERHERLTEKLQKVLSGIYVYVISPPL